MEKAKVNSQSGNSLSRNDSSPKPFNLNTNNRPAPTTFGSDDAPLHEGQYSQVDFEHFRLSSFNVHHSSISENNYPASQVDIDIASSNPSTPFRTHIRVMPGDDCYTSQSELTAMSSVHLNRHCAQTSMDVYSVNQFVSEDAFALLPSAAAEESIQSHTKSMKAYLEAFDLIFYQA
jgi:hypothetical protein